MSLRVSPLLSPSIILRDGQSGQIGAVYLCAPLASRPSVHLSAHFVPSAATLNALHVGLKLREVRRHLRVCGGGCVSGGTSWLTQDWLTQDWLTQDWLLHHRLLLQVG